MSEALQINDDILATARDLASRRGVPVETVVNDLLVTALRPSIGFSPKSGLPVFVLPEGTPPIDPLKVKQAMDEGE